LIGSLRISFDQAAGGEGGLGFLGFISLISPINSFLGRLSGTSSSL
jgi:hypothetical protein